jgi:hypothetical protein
MTAWYTRLTGQFNTHQNPQDAEGWQRLAYEAPSRPAPVASFSTGSVV